MMEDMGGQNGVGGEESTTQTLRTVPLFCESNIVHSIVQNISR